MVVVPFAFAYKFQLLSENRQAQKQYEEEKEGHRLERQRWQILCNEKSEQLYLLRSMPLGSVDAWKYAWVRRNMIALKGI